MRSLTNQGTFLLICGIASFRGTKVHGWKIMVFAFAHIHKTAFVEVRQNQLCYFLRSGCFNYTQIRFCAFLNNRAEDYSHPHKFKSVLMRHLTNSLKHKYDFSKARIFTETNSWIIR